MANTNKITLNTEEMRNFVLMIPNLVNTLPELFAQGDEDEVQLAKKLLSIVDKEVGKLVADFDKLVDKAHDGTRGKDFLAKVTRIHQPRGRKAQTVKAESIVDKIFS